jgi:hypothetical protein
MKQPMLTFPFSNFLLQAQLPTYRGSLSRIRTDLLAAHFALVKSIAGSLVGKTKEERSDDQKVQDFEERTDASAIREEDRHHFRPTDLSVESLEALQYRRRNYLRCEAFFASDNTALLENLGCQNGSARPNICTDA